MWTDGYARTSGSIRRDVYEATATVQGQKLNTTAAMCEVAQMEELCLCSWWSGRVTSHSLSISTQVLLLDVHAATNIPQILYVICYLLNRKKNGNDHSELFCVWWSWLKWRHGEAGGIFCTSSTKFVGVICIISTFDADSTCVWSDCQVGRDDRKVMKHRKYICWFVGEHFDEIIDQQGLLHLIKSRLFTIRQNLVEEKCVIFTPKLN